MLEESDFFLSIADQALWILALAATPILIPGAARGAGARHGAGRDLDQ